jgi:hypothetical protein
MIFEKVVIGKKDFNGFLNFSSKTWHKLWMNNIPEYAKMMGGSLLTFVFMNTAPVNEYD